MLVAVLATIDAVILIVTAALGLTALVQWGKRGGGAVPTAKAVAHATIQITALALWVGFIATGEIWLAWTTFGIITAGQVAGELLAYARFHARHPDVTRPGYLQVVGDGMKLPVPAFHAWVGAVGWFGMLAICIVATVA